MSNQHSKVQTPRISSLRGKVTLPLSSRGHLAISGKAFGLMRAFQCVEARDSTNDLTKHKTDPPLHRIIRPNMSTVSRLNPCSQAPRWVPFCFPHLLFPNSPHLLPQAPYSVSGPDT